MPDVIRARVADAGRVVIPAEYRKAFALEEGQEVVFTRDDLGIRITPLRDAVRQAQDYFAALAPAGVSLADELLRDRRDEAARE
jgi:AbrB family looped-hinge helix DNA binding protein